MIHGHQQNYRNQFRQNRLMQKNRQGYPPNLGNYNGMVFGIKTHPVVDVVLLGGLALGLYGIASKFFMKKK